MILFVLVNIGINFQFVVRTGYTFFLKNLLLCYIEINQMSQESDDRESLQKAFGDHLRKLRISKGLSAAEVGRRAGMIRSNVSRIESGERNPTLLILTKIAQALDMELSDLFKGFKI